MRICFFTENFNKGGLDTFLINLINFWPIPEDELTLLCNKNHPGIESILEKTGANLILKKYNRLFLSDLSRGYCFLWNGQLKPVKKIFGAMYRALEYPILFPWYVLSLALFFRKSQFDRLMVVNGGYPGSLLCRAAAISWKLSGKKHLCLFNIHSSASTPKKLVAPIENLIDNLLVKSTKLFICVSNNSVDCLKRRNSFSAVNNILYIYNGISDPIAKDAVRLPANKKTQPPYILMLATLDKYKGHKFLLKSFQILLKSIPNTELKIFGHGSEEQKREIQREISSLQLTKNVLLGDFVANPKSLILNASVMVVPSQEYEAFGLTIIEAMALRTPIVATNVGGMPEVLGGSGAGFICDKNDAEQFAEYISLILKDPISANRLGENGRKTFEERFNAAMMANKYHLAIQ
ncbi:glycosyltransferase family 4 protein [Polynucleobacter sp. MWH-Aus1W21]|uniref:glycosyltransferase family 4 protein n=1 Tax=Polynucleobacter sp. MWH-Aus1W21 TaxID=1855880 RepID=UPI001BFE783C|nr:glycosyltransferase family 4 protein [Polynucleobacter sp. MWH-Aus1W21]QWD66570.1 glycosyltransferase family 4 protein [Polynucleobacter sp. MWH-Aus1W21]